jgi:MFS family permease
VQNYHGLLAVRIMLGVTEAGFFPAATFLVSTWYCRFEVQTRIAIFYCAASLAGAFSGLLAYGISKMDGIANIAGWRWIFILEGALTILTGIAVLFLLPDSIERASWLSHEEKGFLRRRLQQDTGTKEGRVNTAEKFQTRYLIRALTDWKLWFTVFIYWGNT